MTTTVKCTGKSLNGEVAFVQFQTVGSADSVNLTVNQLTIAEAETHVLGASYSLVLTAE